jgi:hypothetical protein
MSELGQKQTLERAWWTSALFPEPDVVASNYAGGCIQDRSEMADFGAQWRDRTTDTRGFSVHVPIDFGSKRSIDKRIVSYILQHIR